MSVTLFIDTSAINTAHVALEIDGKRYEKVSESKVLKSQMTLPMIEEILAEHKLKISDITAITVATGPGSFTGLRVGATVANALGYLLHVPVNGKKALVIPSY
ncbi:MAG: tRNA (adenosine(37)-N6)-threonylcarbamoyltransferase complex dimerization subunit type 1 TsaB [Candidatus Gottesmanbacteria bacterium]|nr:tRNA (adenosine(37)-N6)-threonylcarbamoyltransferase complex dimerization subunit type 1 TsaB [Candidatus Gottesmanbacteria bacterium]